MNTSIVRRAVRGSASVVALIGGCNSVAVPSYYDGIGPLVVDANTPNPNEHPLVGPYVQSEYWLDFEPPTDAELADLGHDDEPAMATPWVTSDDVEVSISWTLTNDTDQPIRSWVLVDGATEFYDWNPVVLYGIGGGEDADELPFPSLLGFFPRQLEGGQTVRGEYREDDLREAMYDLDVMSRFCGGPLAVLYNRSEVDPVGTEQVPPDARTAGMVMLRLTLGASGPATLEYAIRVRDRDGILYDDRRDEGARYDPMPEPYIPSGFAQVPAGQLDPSTRTEFCGTTMPAAPGERGAFR